MTAHTLDLHKMQSAARVTFRCGGTATVRSIEPSAHPLADLFLKFENSHHGFGIHIGRNGILVPMDANENSVLEGIETPFDIIAYTNPPKGNHYVQQRTSRPRPRQCG